jgi:hypothetical protein
LQSELPGETVEAFYVPNYTREQLESGPRIVVRNAGRTLTHRQGPDAREVQIQVGVIGVVPEQSSTTYRTDELSQLDEYDELIEQIIGLWTPEGPLTRAGMAEHSFESIEQVTAFDAQKLYGEGVFLSILQLTYRDSEDE